MFVCVWVWKAGVLIYVCHLAHPGFAFAHGLPPLHSLPKSSLSFIERIKEKSHTANDHNRYKRMKTSTALLWFEMS